MYPLLAIDTCLGAVSAALEWRDGDGRSQISADWETCRGGHAERLLPMIAALLKEAGLAGRDLRRIAVTLGPGMFTGVRTGIAVARGLALACGAEIVGTTSLATIAAGLADVPGARIAIAVDARKGDVFLQLFDAPQRALGEPLLLPVAAAAAHLAGHHWLIAGSGAVAVAEHAAEVGFDIIETQDTAEPDAASLLGLARTLTPLASVTPLYIRPPDAIPQAGKSLPRADA